MAIFMFKVSGIVMVKFCQIPDLCRKVQLAQISDSARLVEFLIIVTHKAPTVWSHFMDHQKAERVAYRNGIQNLRSFRQSETQKLSAVPPRFCLETAQNSITSKPFVRRS
jgi:hypothetical protein